MAECVNCGRDVVDVEMREQVDADGHTFRALLCSRCVRTGTRPREVKLSSEGGHVCKDCGTEVFKSTAGPGRYPSRCPECKAA